MVKSRLSNNSSLSLLRVTQRPIMQQFKKKSIRNSSSSKHNSKSHRGPNQGRSLTVSEKLKLRRIATGNSSPTLRIRLRRNKLTSLDFTRRHSVVPSKQQCSVKTPQKVNTGISRMIKAASTSGLRKKCQSSRPDKIQ